jgi:hypothetical protein
MREKGRMRPKGFPIYMFLVQLDCGDSPHYCGDSTHFCVDFTHPCVNFTHFHGDSTHLCVDSTDPWKPLLGMSELSLDCLWAAPLCLRLQYHHLWCHTCQSSTTRTRGNSFGKIQRRGTAPSKQSSFQHDWHWFVSGVWLHWLGLTNSQSQFFKGQSEENHKEGTL